MATFTRKHFKMTAETLAKIDNVKCRDIQTQEWIAIFAKSNPRFSKSIFVEYVNSEIAKLTKN